MISTKVEQEFFAYKKRLTQHPNSISYFFNLPLSRVQYHKDGDTFFGAVFDLHCNFRSYLPKIDFN